MEILINSISDLIELFDLYKERNSCNHSTYDEWTKVNPNVLKELKILGKVNLKHNLVVNTNYWGIGSPIELEKYPYSNSEIYLCTKCNCKFFYYIEDGGHGSEMRLRKIHRETIVDKTQEYYLNLAIPSSIQKFHKIIKKDLNFPEFHGENWDALWDTITGIVEMPPKITFYNYSIFLNNWKENAEPLKDIIKKYNYEMKKEIKLINETISLIINGSN